MANRPTCLFMKGEGNSKLNMKIISFLNISEDNDGNLVLPAEEQNINHVGTMHAAAQFALAEFASGRYLQDKFPEFKNEIIGLVRKSSLRYRNPAQTELKAEVSAADEDEKNLAGKIMDRGRAGITLNVNLTDSEDNKTLEASFEWFLIKNGM